jgi:hypothetical protein
MTFKISEKEYLKNPSGFLVHFVGWSAKGRPWAMVERVKK